MVHYTQPVVFTTRPLSRCRINQSQLIPHNLFSLACVTKIRHISSDKMISVGLEPQWYITQTVVFTTRPLASFEAYRNLFTLTFFSLVCVKMTSVGFEPQWYIIPNL
jgi:hypothetical protein